MSLFEDMLLFVSCFVICCTGFLSSIPVPLIFTSVCLVAGFLLGGLTALALLAPSIFFGMIITFKLSRSWCSNKAQDFFRSKFPTLVVFDASMNSVFILRFSPVPFAFQNLFWAVCTDISGFRFMAGSIPVLSAHIALLTSVGAASSNLYDALHSSIVPVPVIIFLAVLSGICLILDRKWRQSRVTLDVSQV